MHVHRWGEPGGTPLVFWHALGPGASAEYFGEVAERLGACGYEVFGVDGPGFGRSERLGEPEDYRLACLARVLRAQIESLQLERPVLAGHSWGGAVTVTYAGAYPEDVRALVLLDSGHMDYADLEEARARPEPDADVKLLAMYGLLDRISPAWDVITAHRIPTLALLATEPPHGEQNRAHIAKFESAMPHAEIRWVEGAGHGIVDTTGPGLGDEIAHWLA
jgi:pimeloyl-ACP methyl ester carboxylesterase